MKIEIKKYVDVETGEVREIPTVVRNTNNFHKVFLKDFLCAIGCFSNNSVDILLYIFGSMDSKNIVYFTYDEIMRDCKIKNRNTIGKTIKNLQKANIICKQGQSKYMVNPALIYKGDLERLGYLMVEYRTKGEM